MKLIYTLTVFIVHQLAQAQSGNTLYGYVQDAQTGEKLIGATVKLMARPTGTSTNQYGFFSLSTAPGDSILVSYVGYQSVRLGSQSAPAGPLTVRLRPDVTELGAVTVRQSTGKDTYDEATMGRFVVGVFAGRSGKKKPRRCWAKTTF